MPQLWLYLLLQPLQKSPCKLTFNAARRHAGLPSLQWDQGATAQLICHEKGFNWKAYLQLRLSNNFGGSGSTATMIQINWHDACYITLAHLSADKSIFLSYMWRSAFPEGLFLRPTYKYVNWDDDCEVLAIGWDSKGRCISLVPQLLPNSSYNLARLAASPNFNAQSHTQT